jgi:WD40 repeat protein/tRNA A-37 threonylcarbamoyl transferase component Bud32
MIPTASCPDATRLAAHLNGRLSPDEQSALVAHLDACGACQRALEELAVGDSGLLGTARQVGQEPPDYGAAFRDVLEGLRTGHGCTTAPVFEFLGPPTRQGPLGRLGHYEVTEVLGRGGMGTVFQAFDEKLRRVVAVKVMAPQLAANDLARRRFVREAQSAAAVRNEHVIDIHAVEEAHGFPYLVMEYVAGRSLQQRLDAAGPLELEDILRIGLQTATGLAAAHAQGLVHRDIKPANILLENGVARVKITDMAPEQARGEPLDHRADLFSLGSVLYAMCTGAAPFTDGPPLAVLKRITDGPPRPVRELNPAIPAWLAAVIERLHAPDPARRFQTAAEVADLCRHYLADLQRGHAPGPPRQPRPLAGARRWAVAAAVLLAAIGVIGATEAVGVTKLLPAVIRIVQGDGTLVLEVDDPQVKVTVEGDGEVVISGAGPQEVRLRPGSYRLRASRGGKTVREELVTIQRGGRRIVRVSREEDVADAADAAVPPAAGPDRRFRGHTGTVRCVALSPDGKLALSGGDGGSVRLWDVASGQELRRFDGHADDVTAVAFSRDGKQAATAGADRVVRLWDVATGGPVGRLQGHTDEVQCVAFSPDGRSVVSGSSDGTLRLWDTARLTEARALFGHRGRVTSVAVSDDGRRILSGGDDGAVRVWVLATGAEVRRLDGHAREVFAVAFSPDGHRAVSGGNDRTVRLWNLDDGRELRRLDGHVNAVIRVAFAADGRQVLSASSQYGVADRTIRVWDAGSGQGLRSFGGGPTDRVGCAAFSADGRFALTGGSDTALKQWTLAK